jgi:hypothetical protein
MADRQMYSRARRLAMATPACRRRQGRRPAGGRCRHHGRGPTRIAHRDRIVRERRPAHVSARPGTSWAAERWTAARPASPRRERRRGAVPHVLPQRTLTERRRVDRIVLNLVAEPSRAATTTRIRRDRRPLRHAALRRCLVDGGSSPGGQRLLASGRSRTSEVPRDGSASARLGRSCQRRVPRRNGSERDGAAPRAPEVVASTTAAPSIGPDHRVQRHAAAAASWSRRCPPTADAAAARSRARRGERPSPS